MQLSARQFTLLIVLTLMWGLNWPIMKYSLRELSPLYFRAVTMSGGVLLLLLFYRLRGTAMALPRASWGAVALLALPNVFGWHLFSILGVQALASGRAAILGFTMPVWTVLLAALLFGQPMGRRAWVSVACALVAVTLLVGHELTALAGRPLGIVWMQLAAVSWALRWGAAVNYGISQVIWFGMARSMPPQASTFSIMAVPLVGTLSATLIVSETPRMLDYFAAGFIMLAIASALLPVRKGGA